MFGSMLNMADEIKSGKHQKVAFPAHITVHKATSNNPIDFVEEEEHRKRHDHSGNHHKEGHHHGHHGHHHHNRHHHEPPLSPTRKLNEIEEEPHFAQQAHGHPSHLHGHLSPHKHGHHHHGHHGPGLIDSHALHERYRAFDTVGKLQAPHLMTAYDLSSFQSAVDLGAGTGCMGFELARVYDNMQVTLMDVPRVTELVKHHFMPPDINALKIEFLPGDFFITELPEADLCVLIKIVHDWNDEQVDKLVHLCFEKINPGGGILLFEKCLNDHKDGPVSAHMWDTFIMTLCAGRLRSGKEYRHLLENVGFTQVQIHRTQEQCTFDIIYARKP
uniref:Acetylserotonin O-methyltransferase n=1 Tax=Platynereis dumerilii TaxID=6359 RepID=G8Z9G5_PLADU|nr:putative methyl transferase [Platynereis dumerilii]